MSQNHFEINGKPVGSFDTVVRADRQLVEPGHVYHAQDFVPDVLAGLVADNVLVGQGYDLFACLKHSRFGAVPPTEEALVRAYLRGAPFVVTGTDLWNALGLGSTAVFARTLVYNTKVNAEVRLGGRLFEFRQVEQLPAKATREWAVVDLLENAARVSASVVDLAKVLGQRVAGGQYNRAALREAAKHASSKTQSLVNAHI